MAVGGANFLFITSRKEYYATLRTNADVSAQTALLWRQSAISNLNTRAEVLEELYAENFDDIGFNNYSKPNVFVLFDNEKFRSKKLIKETEHFRGVPLFSVVDTDSVEKGTIFPIIGNDDSVQSIYFYSLFVSYCIVREKT
jgi:ribosomal protein S2